MLHIRLVGEKSLAGLTPLPRQEIRVDHHLTGDAKESTILASLEKFFGGKNVDFELTKEQEDIRRAAREFAEAELTKDYQLECERNHKFPLEFWKKACKLGFIGMDFPEKYGGQGYGIFEAGLVAEEFCRVGSAIGGGPTVANFGSKMILNRGTEKQKKKYLPPLFSGEAISAGTFTEPDRGSDLVTFPLSTTAVKDGSDYVINGTKTFASFTPLAKFAIVLCQTDPEAKPPYRGESTIVVNMDTPGIEITELEKMGMHTTPTTETRFTNVRVPQENLVGEENRGFYNAIEFLDEYRCTTAFQCLGMAQGAFDRALEYAKTREAFGHKIGTFQAISHKLSDMATKIEAIRLLTYKSAWAADKGLDDPKIFSMAKWYSARVALEVADEAIEIMGGHGYMLENEVERFYRDAKGMELLEGTREIQKNTIARYLLGKLE